MGAAAAARAGGGGGGGGGAQAEFAWGGQGNESEYERRQQMEAQRYALQMFNEWRSHVDARLTSLENSSSVVAQTLARLEANMPSRADVEAASRTRLDIGTYTVAHQALIDRVSRLESGPQRLVSWIALMVSGGIGCLMAMISGLALLVSIAGVLIAFTHP
ncbi:MAG TPA: hypothetical protein VFU72_11275 [Nitrolancea sp.]|nr:hypothetical protein [Nitrolancea sp.]